MRSKLISAMLLLFSITEVSAFTVNGGGSLGEIPSKASQGLLSEVPVGSRVEVGTGSDACEAMFQRVIRSTMKEIVFVTSGLANRRIAGDIAGLASRKSGRPARVLLVVNQSVSDSERVLLDKVRNAGGNVKFIDAPIDQTFAVIDGRHVVVGGGAALKPSVGKMVPVTSMVLIWNDELSAHRYLEQWAEAWRKAREEKL